MPRTAVFTPSEHKDTNNEPLSHYAGSMTLNCPTATEALSYMKRVAKKQGDEVVANFDEVIPLLKKHVVTVEIENKLIGEKYKTIDEMLDDSINIDCITSAYAFLINGCKPTKKKK